MYANIVYNNRDKMEEICNNNYVYARIIFIDIYLNDVVCVC